MKVLCIVLVFAFASTAYAGFIKSGWSGGGGGWNYGGGGGGWNSGWGSGGGGKIVKVITLSGGGWPSSGYSSGWDSEWPSSGWSYGGGYSSGWKPSGWSSGGSASVLLRRVPTICNHDVTRIVV
ncbi:hypothetical protein PV328_001854 [Microctonus aethiopoides]|uniref:Uncharacterized protein n=1 Tax=Microctonus aethiopoides TaxID=144406 RepID=A0AA39FYL7_9HYME|nr:hypothetical protein PV328_001854 [Microctonus aethiopoides]